MTEEIYDVLSKAQSYEFQCRGKVKVKGKGEMTTYFLTDRRAPSTMRMDDLASTHLTQQLLQQQQQNHQPHPLIQQPVVSQEMVFHQQQQMMLQQQRKLEFVQF